MGESVVVDREPCPDCNSKDNLVRFDDGHAYCFSQGCGRYEHGPDAGSKTTHRPPPAELLEGDVRPLTARGISLETCRRFRYLVGKDKGRTAQLATYCDANGIPVAQKVRYKDKRFRVVGDLGKAGLFGQHIWRHTGRFVIVTEGEIDALSYAEATDCKWPVVSLPTGAAGAEKALRKQIEWLEGFDTVVLAFDMDEPGQAAAKQCAELFSPGKVRIAQLPEKDLNEVLLKHGPGAVAKTPWDARPFRPDDLVVGSDLWDLVSTEPEGMAAIPYPWPGLTHLTHGLRRGEIVTLCAGSGIGKSTICREIAHHLHAQGETVGIIALEESVRRSALGLMSIELGVPLHLRFGDVEQAALRRAFDATLGTGRIILYDHWGSIEGERLMAKVRSMVKMFDVRWIVLDHISIVISGLEVENERRELDMAMTQLRTLAEELKIGIIVVSHLKRVNGKPFELGGQVNLSDLRGSAALEQLSDLVVAGERNQQDEEDQNLLTLRVLKNRFSGDTGLAGTLEYHKDTGRLLSADGFDDDEEDDFGEDRTGPDRDSDPADTGRRGAPDDFA